MFSPSDSTMRDAEENLVKRAARTVWGEARRVVHAPSVHAPSEVETGRVKQGEGFQRVASRPEVVWSRRGQGQVTAGARFAVEQQLLFLGGDSETECERCHRVVVAELSHRRHPESTGKCFHQKGSPTLACRGGEGTSDRR